ncbi:globin-like protein [Polychytrium aggregatum]|uniref:globin-like protein n=1 Tax=Polychytrium aggregatum TaxID=110093 RepID=UPI0022FDD84C|nr:globin-like protein [Polychytrium aggregatum]KAI9203866.1 globin-like protein [Polychytrium aggregatum]
MNSRGNYVYPTREECIIIRQTWNEILTPLPEDRDPSPTTSSCGDSIHQAPIHEPMPEFCPVAHTSPNLSRHPPTSSATSIHRVYPSPANGRVVQIATYNTIPDKVPNRLVSSRSFAGSVDSHPGICPAMGSYVQPYSDTQSIRSEVTGNTNTKPNPATQFTMRFYENLFVSNPEYRHMFPDVFRQSAALSGILMKIVRDVDRMELGMDAARHLGYRHFHIYKVTPDMYDTMGRNLVGTVREFLIIRGKWSHEVDWAWITVWRLLSTWMKEGADTSLIPGPFSSPYARDERSDRSDRGDRNDRENRSRDREKHCIIS